jgi:hypothetical protein
MILGSRTLVTDVGGALRGWLIYVAEGLRMPSVLSLPDQPFGARVRREEAHLAVNQEGSRLHEQLNALTEDQLRALAAPNEGGRTGHELVARVLRYWDRPRLVGVDWRRVGPASETTKVTKWIQEEDWDLAPGDAVMLAGDGFEDVHATVVEDLGKDWRVRLHWHEWDRPS